ncbi:MAG: DUF6399 domain-containing protein [Cyanobacteria bacterium P01_B01_bin.77]
MGPHALVKLAVSGLNTVSVADFFHGIRALLARPIGSALGRLNRGFSAQSLKVLTIIHNFDLKRPDVTTAVQRLFSHTFPDLFEWIISTINEPPMPRRASKAHLENPSHVEIFLA